MLIVATKSSNATLLTSKLTYKYGGSSKSCLISCKKEIRLKGKVNIIFRIIQNPAEGKSLMLIVAKKLLSATRPSVDTKSRLTVKS